MRIPTIQNNLIPTVKDETGLDKAKTVARYIISRRISGEKLDRHDMVSSLKNHGLTQDKIADELF